jgi:SPRY domain
LCVGAYAIDDELDIFLLVIASIVDRESFKKQCRQLDSDALDYLATRLDYYQVQTVTSRQYRAHSSLIIVDDNLSMKVTTTTTINNNGVIWDASIHKYTVTVNKSDYMYIFIGFAPSKLFDVSEGNNACGWYLNSYNGARYSQNGDGGSAYSSECHVGDTIACIYNELTMEISFEKNGVSLGVAFTNVKGEDIAPAVKLFSAGDSITLSSDN